MPPFSLVTALLLMTPLDNPAPAGNEPPALTDFTSATADFGWYVVNDNVMGGRSDGGFEIDAGELHFTGRTNTRGGGFSSIRTGPLALDLSDHDGIRLRVKGDGRRYTWRLTTDARFYGREVAYWADFDTVAGEWQSVDIPFADFVPRFRGSVLDGPALDTAAIRGMGLMIYDRRDGPFELRLSGVATYAEASPVTMAQWRWQKRVLVISAASEEDASFGTQLEALQASEAEFAERDLVLISLLDDSGAAADRQLSAQQVAGLREALDIEPGAFALRLVGKDGGTKLSREAPVSMLEIYGLIDTMPMRRQEMRDRRD